jgi:hypothetical protein
VLLSAVEFGVAHVLVPCVCQSNRASCPGVVSNESHSTLEALLESNGRSTIAFVKNTRSHSRVVRADSTLPF